MDTLDRKTLLRRGLLAGGGIAALGPLHSLGAQVAHGARPPRVPGYGPLVNKGDLWLPEDFNYKVIQRQGEVMSDGNLVPGIFDGMAAYRGKRGTIVLIRNHENRRQAGEIPVIVPDALKYDPTPSVQRRQHEGRHRHRPAQGHLRGARDLCHSRRDGHELRRRHDALGLLAHVRGGRQPQRGRDQARVRLRHPVRGDRPGEGRADHRRRALRPRGGALLRRRALPDRGPHEVGLATRREPRSTATSRTRRTAPRTRSRRRPASSRRSSSRTSRSPTWT